MAKRWINSSDVEVSDNGALLVSLGTAGLPIPLTIVDPAADTYTATLTPNPIDRACTQLRVIVGDSGCVISLDGGTTDSISLPPNTMDDLAVNIAASTDIRVKRYTAGTAMTDLIVEVR